MTFARAHSREHVHTSRQPPATRCQPARVQEMVSIELWSCLVSFELRILFEHLTVEVLIDSKEKPKKFGLSLLSALAQKDVRTAEAAMEAGADMKLVDDKGDAAIILIASSSE